MNIPPVRAPLAAVLQLPPPPHNAPRVEAWRGLELAPSTRSFIDGVATSTSPAHEGVRQALFELAGSLFRNAYGTDGELLAALEQRRDPAGSRDREARELVQRSLDGAPDVFARQIACLKLLIVKLAGNAHDASLRLAAARKLEDLGVLRGLAGLSREFQSVADGAAPSVPHEELRRLQAFALDTAQGLFDNAYGSDARLKAALASKQPHYTDVRVSQPFERCAFGDALFGVSGLLERQIACLRFILRTFRDPWLDGELRRAVLEKLTEIEEQHPRPEVHQEADSLRAVFAADPRDERVGGWVTVTAVHEGGRLSHWMVRFENTGSEPWVGTCTFEDARKNAGMGFESMGVPRGRAAEQAIHNGVSYGVYPQPGMRLRVAVRGWSHTTVPLPASGSVRVPLSAFLPMPFLSRHYMTERYVENRVAEKSAYRYLSGPWTGQPKVRFVDR